MRRDIDRHLDFTYSVAILDEAQQIKNRTTQNALAAKKLKRIIVWFLAVLRLKIVLLIYGQ